MKEQNLTLDELRERAEKLIAELTDDECIAVLEALRRRKEEGATF